MSTFYHYTTGYGADGIGSSRVIRKTSISHRDAFLGQGVYLTSMPPWLATAFYFRRVFLKVYLLFRLGKRAIAMNNYDGQTVRKLERVVRAIKVTLNREKLISGQGHWKFRGRDVYLYRGDLHLDGPDVIDWEIVDV